jgi:hypothetical protein
LCFEHRMGFFVQSKEKLWNPEPNSAFRVIGAWFQKFAPRFSAHPVKIEHKRVKMLVGINIRAKHERKYETNLFRFLFPGELHRSSVKR